MELFGGVTITNASPQLAAALQRRSDFVAAYCRGKGWAMPLSLEQVLEIRSQDGWKSANGGRPLTAVLGKDE